MRRKDQAEEILEHVPVGVFTIDTDFNVTFFNRAAEQLTGTPREQAIGRKCHEIFHSTLCRVECLRHLALSRGKPVVDCRATVRARGEAIPIRVNFTPLRDEDGELIGGVEYFLDLSSEEILRKEIDSKYDFHDIVSRNHQIRRILDIIPDIADSGSTALIEGPSGSGKELFARAIHNAGDRRDKSFVAVNCGALPDTLLESELFGYVRGAFTDARRDKPGRFAVAADGTIFLDEIGDISPAVQVKLLRVLQEKTYEPLGSNKPSRVDARVIAATNKSLPDLIAKGLFREDLYYRLNVVKLTLPPLSARREDIPLLTRRFIERFNAKTGRQVTGVSDAAMALLMAYAFPGNIRELENLIEYAFVLCKSGEIGLEHLPERLRNAVAPSPSQTTDPVPAFSPLELAEIETLREALKNHSGRRDKAAESLGLHKSTLWRKMKKYHLV